MKMEQIFESLKYANDLKFSEIEEEFELWEKAAKSYFPEGYTILGIKYFDNSEISMQIIKKHKIKNDAYMIIASKIDRNDDRSDILIEQKWIDRSELLIN